MFPLFLALFASMPQAQTSESAPAPAMLRHAELSARLHALVGAHQGCAVLYPIGRSRKDRAIELVRLAAGDPPPGRPAILFVANIDGPQVFTSAIALALAERVATGFADDAAIRALLESTTLYVLPRANPDAAEARFETPLFERESGGYGVDNDRDRRAGEDEPSDVDGDGRIAQMRWLDPEGEWIVDPTDARAMIKADAKKGERGLYKLAVEGRDLDRDEKTGEDPASDTVLDQNFPWDWKEHGENAGRFPLDEPEARALADFVIEHKDIALVVTYGALDNLVDKPKTVAPDAPAQRRVPQSGVLQPDADLLAELGKRYAEATGAKVKGRGANAGSFQDWCYFHRGIVSLQIAPWDIPIEPAKKDGEKKDGEKKPDAKAGEGAGEKTPEKAPEKPPEKSSGEEAKPDAKPGAKPDAKKDAPTPSDDAKRIAWMDGANEGSRFIAWHSFQHPELGAVEVGGIAPFARTEPPEGERAELARKQIDFALSLAPLLGRIELGQCTAKALGADVVEVEAAVSNAALLPLYNASARRTQSVRPARVRLYLPEGAALLAGQKQELVRELGGSGARTEFRWLVRGARAQDLRIQVDTDHAGGATSSFEVKR
jgi:hypothetical protein